MAKKKKKKSENEKVLDEVRKLRQEVARLTEANPNVPIPGKRCTIHVNCSGGSQYCNDGGPITDWGIGW
jgi:hypothetical protein